MEKNYRLMHLKKLETLLTGWKKDFNRKNAQKTFLEIVKSVCLDLSLGILVTSGNRKPIGYCGPYYKCQKLRKKFGENCSIIPVGYYWCWIGYGDAKVIEKLLTADGYSKIYNLKAQPQDVEEITFYLADKLSYDSRFGDTNIVMAYIGSRAICIRLRHQFHGKIGRNGDIWYWIGTKIDFEKMDAVIYSYRKNAKRCNKKGLVKD